MKKSVLMLVAALTLGSIAGAQSIRPGAPDVIAVDLGVVTSTQFNFTDRPTLHLYGNASVQERLYSTSSGDLFGSLVVGNSYDDYTRFYAEGGLGYQVNNVNIYGALRQGFYAQGFKNAGTSLRLGIKANF